MINIFDIINNIKFDISIKKIFELNYILFIVKKIEIILQGNSEMISVNHMLKNVVLSGIFTMRNIDVRF